MGDGQEVIISPRLLDVKAAAAYCGVSPSTFREKVPVEPRRIGRRCLYDRKMIDRWLDGSHADADQMLEVFLNGQD